MAIKTMCVCLTFLSLFFDCCCKFIPINACILCHLSIDWSLFLFYVLVKVQTESSKCLHREMFQFLGSCIFNRLLPAHCHRWDPGIMHARNRMSRTHRIYLAFFRILQFLSNDFQELCICFHWNSTEN